MKKEYRNVRGVPNFDLYEFSSKQSDYCLLIPIINEKKKITSELNRSMEHGVDRLVDIIICDGGSTDGGTDMELMQSLGVNSLIVKLGEGRQGAQLRTGIYYALQRGYKGVITIDGNDKDSIEHVERFIDKLKAGYDFVQGSRFIDGGVAVNTPKSRDFAIKLIHAPLISLTAGERFTDTTNNFRAYSARYLKHPHVKPLRPVFSGYELLAYLSTRASQLGMKTCEVPVERRYPSDGKVPTKISPIKGNLELMGVLLKNTFKMYNPR